jgi:hypothetical protein
MMDNSVMDNTASDMNQAPVEQIGQTNSERLFRQSELNEIVGRAKHDAVESFKRQNAQQQSQSTQQSYAQQSNNSQKTLSEDDVKRLTTEELGRQREEWERQTLEKKHADEAQRIVSAYKDKIAAGRDKYQDFEAVTSNVDMRYYPNVVQLLAEHVDNSADILYDLAKNRTKLGNLEFMCGHNPQDAIYEIKRLAESIKANESSSQIRSPNTPLSQQRPSNTGTDSGALSMTDLKRKYRA